MFGSTSNSSGSGLFGSNNNTGSGLFGGAKPASTGFGSTTGGTNPGFGANTSTNANTGGGGLFGSNNNTNTQGGSTNATNGGLFGSSSNAGGSNTGQPASGGLFGSQNNASQQAPSGGLFGNNANSSAPNAPNASGGLFGNSNANSNNNANNATNPSGGLFGNKPASSGGLFGASGNTSNTGGGLFGSNNANNNTTSGNTGATGGLFGNKPASSGGLFGSSNNTSNTGGGLFGSNNTSGSTGGGLFGSNNNASANTNQGSGGLFGTSSGNSQQPPNSQQTGGLFGQNTTNNQQPSFGWSNQNQASNQISQPLFDTKNKLNNPNLNNPTSTLNSNNNAASSYNNYTPAINDQLIKIKEQWDPNSAKCALKTHLYNKLSDQEINFLLNQQRPSNESPEDWDNAMSNRPSPNHYPTKVTSFTDVAQRIELQLDQVAKSRILLNGINEKQSSLSSKHDLDNTTRILKAKARHVKLLRRLLRLATVLAILKLKGYPLLPEEEELSKQFDLLNQKLNDPSGSLGKLNDVFARLAILKERSEDLSYQFDSSLNSMNNAHGNNQESHSEKDLIDDGKNNDEVINRLSKLLLKQQVGLNHLNDVLEKDLESVNKLTIKN
ncbi:uncharacterized protein AC631_04932 [Debaryomyces fabryi]|uniref:Nucleoporin Nup54 alpha-helical domain-containing protein n=1 Tax=Debaryomyces fabryi TaxID=58627 RepID=A0A0V1PSS7_9ASCO|nr:uncharacterized protein AC631_04932 [Debaryomyces fabryi]KRZ99309.1 hypothetical protein AC631_04932 [Debaryomyces fabryi]CUM46431.1 unnamed protein product [Debaryomyces fabryi]